MKKSLQILLSGLVQGVGFRPFIYRLAQTHQLSGWISNRTDGVVIHVKGDAEELQKFINEIHYRKPEISSIEDLIIHETNDEISKGFFIKESTKRSNEITQVSPDLAVCEGCLQDMQDQERRLNYPFVNCTNCGPRFSIVKDIPYDRPNTTMAAFEMCDECASEYEDINDRRFHAQPIACKQCGPHYELFADEECITDLEEILNKTAEVIDNGGIATIKGLGGFFIACDSWNEEAVRKLRQSKKRYGKPFAVMFRSLEALKTVTYIDVAEARLLTSIQRPIVLLRSKLDLIEGVCQGLRSVGAMLPYMPIHYQLFERLHTDAIVLTSGNISEEPIAIEENDARVKLGSFSDVVLGNNRPIHNRVDDSVLFVAGGRERFIRRSRGYAPQPIKVKMNVEGILAAGAELSNCFAIGKEDQVILSQHIGDLKNEETYDFYLESLEHFKKLFRFMPEMVVSDLHPDYLSTTFADSLSLPHLKVQHHHAHIASCMAEYNLDEQVLGISMDGTGYGTDGKIWGGEFLLCDLKQFDRLYHFECIPIPGGDLAVEQPWRTAFSFLYHYLNDEVFNLDLPFIRSISHTDLELIKYAIDRKINCPESSSAGRLFDAVAAMLNVCTNTRFHAEAPMRLESLINPDIKDCYSYDTSGRVVSFRSLFESALTDLKNNVEVSIIVTRFHNTIIRLIKDMAEMVKEHLGITKVVMSGGTFQNRYLLENAINELEGLHFSAFSNTKVPANDGGIAMGQMVIAAKKRQLQCV